MDFRGPHFPLTFRFQDYFNKNIDEMSLSLTIIEIFCFGMGW